MEISVLNLSLRNTPTGVGKTWSISRTQGRKRKHPHGRGEDLYRVAGENLGERNTPTGVGKTRQGRAFLFWRQKHPHGRGEDFIRHVILPCAKETPPRAWGRHRLAEAKVNGVGNTPTGVGKTTLIAISP